MMTTFLTDNKYILPASFVDLLLDAVCVVDPDGKLLHVSAAFEQIFGYKPEEVIGTRIFDLVAPEDVEATLRSASQVMSGIHLLNFENRYIHKKGHYVHILWSARWCEGDKFRVGVARDITARKHAEARQAAIYAISEAAHETEDIPALLYQIHKIIGRLLPITNFSVAMLHRRTGELVFPYKAEQFAEPDDLQKKSMECFCNEIIRIREPILLSQNDLSALPEHLQALQSCNALCWMGVPLQSAKGIIGALVLKSYSGGTCYSKSDMELLLFVSTQVAAALERKQLHERLQYLAQYDELTGLPNRGLLYDRLEMLLARTRREQSKMALLYMDLNHFKNVNDSYGHAAGDMLLAEMGQRIKSCLRESDTVARMGGDEFVILLESIHSDNCLATVVNKIRAAVAQPLAFGSQYIVVTSSIGVARYPEDGTEGQQLLSYADEAMFQEKRELDKPLQAM